MTMMTFVPPGNHNSFVGNNQPIKKSHAWGINPSFIYMSNIMANIFNLVELVLPDINGAQPKTVYYLQDEDK